MLGFWLVVWNSFAQTVEQFDISLWNIVVTPTAEWWLLYNITISNLSNNDYIWTDKQWLALFVTRDGNSTWPNGTIITDLTNNPLNTWKYLTFFPADKTESHRRSPLQRRFNANTTVQLPIEFLPTANGNELPVWTYNICHIFSIWSRGDAYGGSNILYPNNVDGDINMWNNTKTVCTPFVKWSANSSNNTPQWFDLTIQDITSTYNQQTDKIRYTMKIKNMWNMWYNFVQGTLWAGLMSNFYPENFWLMENLSAFWWTKDYLEMDTTTPVLWSVVWTNTKCHTFKVGILYSSNGNSLLPWDTNIANNTVEKCTTYTGTSSNQQQSTGSTISSNKKNKEDLTITNASATTSYPKSTLTITLANLGKADYDIWSQDPTVKLFCYQNGFKKYGVSQSITNYIWSSQPSITTTLDLKLRWSKKSVKNIICIMDSTNVLKESDERNNTYIFRI